MFNCQSPFVMGNGSFVQKTATQMKGSPGSATTLKTLSPSLHSLSVII